ncbi:hypothetical protein LVD15_11855 [Fulvivirga maritima]|uniref:hypothetical protein n=1 Tax=Fulvivirga maritima TaxID=2904247 RepID=UPI001F464A83|nr:hypothetical protein [Fulvivirga maritima]UII29090.1 hypothetical protein LVD15_11855 [Fulvivirga maritima]
MNERNLEYLQERLYFHGFGNQLEEALKKGMNSQKDHFELNFKGKFERDNKNDIVDYKLHFSKSSTTDRYFWNHYQATLHRQGEPDRSQEFHIQKGNGISARKAYQLLSGNAIYQRYFKSGAGEKPEAFHSWVTLDLKQKNQYGNHPWNYYNQAYGFDLEKALKKHALPAMQNQESRTKLLEQLQRGETPKTKLKQGNQEITITLKADPRFKQVRLIDETGKALKMGQSEKKKQAQQEEIPKKRRGRKAGVR